MYLLKRVKKFNKARGLKMKYTDKDRKEISLKEIQRFYKHRDNLTNLIVKLHKELIKVEEALEGIEIINKE